MSQHSTSSTTVAAGHCLGYQSVVKMLVVARVTVTTMAADPGFMAVLASEQFAAGSVGWLLCQVLTAVVAAAAVEKRKATID